MKTSLKRLTFPAALLGAACAAGAVYAGADDSERPRIDAAANASAALNSGGNPASAIGAAHLNPPATANRAPAIYGNSGTIGLNGDAAAASAANGVTSLSVGTPETIGMRRERLREATARAGVASPAPVLVPARSEVAAPSPGARDQFARQIEMNIASNQRAMDSVRLRARNFDATGAARFRAADDDVRRAELRLQRSLRDAQRASADQWATAQASLADDYDRYAQAVAKAQRISASADVNAEPESR
ncbi:MAG TPA: hypothetical protein VNR00_18890 [Opitutus sp.]|nr:hypothetical protein [Opitutus sp.]